MDDSIMVTSSPNGWVDTSIKIEWLKQMIKMLNVSQRYWLIVGFFKTFKTSFHL